MSFWKQYTSPLGYVSNGNPIDAYGVDHSGFTTRDELQYQTARINRENDLMTQMNNQGITNYPQYGTNFWGTNADNNYGFGTSNIGNNIENRQQTITPVPQMATQPSTPSVQQQPEPSAWDTVKQWGKIFADTVEAGVVGYTTGATLGNFDEAMGGATAALTGNPDNYGMGRDATRKLQNDLRERHPYIYNIAETLGTVTTPMRLFRASKTAPLARHSANRLYNGIMDTGIATIGYSDLSNPYDVLKNAGAIGLGNAAGIALGNRMLGRGGGNMARIGFDALGNSMSNAMTNWFND